MIPHLDAITTVQSTVHERALRQVGRRARLAAPRAAVLPLTCLLSLSTGVTLLVLAGTITPPDLPPVAAAAGPSADAAVTVHAFYAAANHALRTGDLAPLDRLLAPDFVEHADRPGLPPGRDGLLPYLTRLRAAHPTLRFTVEAVLANGDLVTVRVTAGSDPGRPDLGSLTAELQRWSGVDVFRVVEGQVAERWSGSDAPALVQPLAQVPLQRWLPGMSLTAVVHLTMTPGAEISGIASLGPSLLVIEAGELTVRGSGEAQVFQGADDPVVPHVQALAGAEPVLGPGDVVAFPSGTGALSLRNEGLEPVGAIVVVWRPSADGRVDPRFAGPQETGIPPAADSTIARALADAVLPPMDGTRVPNVPGVTVTLLGSLGSIRAAQLPLSGGVLTLERVLLASGTSLPPRAATGSTLLAVEAGRVGLVPVRETAWVLFPTARQEVASAGSETMVAEGEAAFWDAGAVALLGGGQDSVASALLLTMSSAETGRDDALAHLGRGEGHVHEGDGNAG